MEITYTKHGDYYLPDLTLPKEEPVTYGRFGRMRLKYLKEHRRGTYTSLLTSGQLTHYLNEIDREANDTCADGHAAFAEAEDRAGENATSGRRAVEQS